MVVDFSKIDLHEPPILILKNSAMSPIGVLGYAMNITADIKYNETSEITFDIPAQVDGVLTPFYKSVIGMRIVELQDVGQFILVNPEETSDGVKTIKSCKGYSLEYEFTFKKISMESATYNFWNPVTPDSTLLGIILEMMPSWSVGEVDDSLIGKYRTFEVSDENLYNFIKDTAQNSYNCIFDFDTFNRKINVRDASSVLPTNPVYISNNNLASEISVEEDTESIVTRLDVNGADGVDIRDVNPSGTNQIINLDYFMTTDNFDQELIDKYYKWKKEYEDAQLPYYNLSVEYALQVMRKTTEQAALVELETERTVLENEQAVTIQSVALDIQDQATLDDVNQRIAAKQAEIDAKSVEIQEIEKKASEIYKELIAFNKQTNFKSYFTEEEYLQLDRYLKDDAVSESSFVTQTTDTYDAEDIGNAVENKAIAISDASITYVKHATDKSIYDIKGGRIKADFVDAEIISAALERSQNDSFILTAYLASGESSGREFPKGCISLTGTLSSLTSDLSEAGDGSGLGEGTKLNITVKDGYMYLTFNTSEYEKRAVAWDLFEYGNEILEKVSQPSYTFDVTSANFLALEEFESFKNSLRSGEKLYVGISEDETLAPICVGVQIDYNSPADLTMEFSDTYVSGDSSFLLADLLEQSVSMGKTVDLSKYTYSAFMDSGASTKVKDFMNAALDVSKNAIMSSQAQAISWGDSGIRLRKWTDDTHTAYDPKQVWMNNNSILMTKDNWSTAELAIGNFKDDNLGDCWGVVAPNIVGTLLAGSNLVIESAKEDGGVAVFKVDADGCALHNSSISVTNSVTNADGSTKSTTQILLDPTNGFIIGKYPLYNTDGTINDDQKVFYADTDGNLTLKGTVYATDGEFTGKITATSGYIGNNTLGWTIGDSAIYNGKATFGIPGAGIYLGTDSIQHINGGLALGDGTNYILAHENGLLEANNVNLTGKITATSGNIGGCTISNGVLKVNSANIDSLDASVITSGTMSADRIDGGTISGDLIYGGTIDGDDVKIKNLNASYIKSGTLDCDDITVKNFSADSITAGTLTADYIGGLPASRITSGVFATARIPDLKADKITAGTLDCNAVTLKNLSAEDISTGSLSADRISGGTLTGVAINIGSGKFKVTSGGYVQLNIRSFSVYSSKKVGTYGIGYHEGQTFQMQVARRVVAGVASYINLVFVQGVCCGWTSVD